MNTEVSMGAAALIVQTPGTNYAVLNGYMLTVAFMAIFFGAITWDFVPFVVTCAVGLGGFRLIEDFVIKTPYRLEAYPTYWRLFMGKNLVSEGSLPALVGFDSTNEPFPKSSGVCVRPVLSWARQIFPWHNSRPRARRKARMHLGLG